MTNEEFKTIIRHCMKRGFISAFADYMYIQPQTVYNKLSYTQKILEKDKKGLINFLSTEKGAQYIKWTSKTKYPNEFDYIQQLY